MKGIPHRVLTILLITVMGFVNVQSQTSSQASLAVQEFAEKIRVYPDAPVIDVRTPEEFAKGHLPDAKNFDWNGERIMQHLATLDKSKPVFIYCLSGGRSAAALKKMHAEGFTQVFELAGGILKWRSADLPEVASPGGIISGMTRKQFDDLLQSDKLVLINFYADWCAPCKKMKPYMEQISQEKSNEVVVIRINADENPALCKELSVDALPVLRLYKNRTLIWTKNGYVSKDEILTHL